MNKYLSVVIASLFLVMGFSVHAGEQQEKMKSCNADATAKQLKGDDRKAFMKTCLSAKAEPVAASSSTQQEKMKSCNADAKTKQLKGDERKAFMKQCLSKKSAA